MTELSALNIRITGDSSNLTAAIDAAASAMTDMQRKANSFAGVLDQTSNSAKRSAEAFAAFDSAARQVDSLRASIDPLYASSRKYEAAIAQLDNALALGVIKQAEYARMVDRVSQSMIGVNYASVPMVGAMSRVGQAMNSARGSIQNVSFQLQDVAVQLAAGTNASIVFAQQGSQIASAFGPVGAVIGAAFAVVPLLALAFMDTATNAGNLADAMEELTAATEAFRISAQAIKLGVDEEEVLILEAIRKKTAELEAAEQRLRANRGTQDHVNTLKAELAELQKQITAYRAARDEAETLTAENKRVEAAARAAATATSGIGAAAAGAIGQVRALGSAMWDVASAAAARINAERQLDAMKMEFSPAGQAMEKYAGRGTTSSQPVTMGATGAAVGTGTGAGSASGGGGAGRDYASELAAFQQELATETELEAQQYATRQTLLQDFLSAKVITMQEYQAYMEEIKTAHEQRLNEIEAAAYQQRLSEASGVFGALAGIAQAGGQRMVKAVAAFQAVEGTINAYGAAIKALNTPGLGLAGRFAAYASVLAAGLKGVAAIRSAGGVGGGTGASSAAVGGVAQSASGGPLQVSLNTFGAGDFIRAADFGMLLDRLNTEAGDRGYTILRPA